MAHSLGPSVKVRERREVRDRRATLRDRKMRRAISAVLRQTVRLNDGFLGRCSHAVDALAVGMRSFFQPGMCMLQWRHSGLVNFINRTSNALQVRVEGLWIG